MRMQFPYVFERQKEGKVIAFPNPFEGQKVVFFFMKFDQREEEEYPEKCCSAHQVRGGKRPKDAASESKRESTYHNLRKKKNQRIRISKQFNLLNKMGEKSNHYLRRLKIGRC